MKCLGVDPGLLNTGWGIVEYSKNNLEYINYGVIKTNVKEKLNCKLIYIFNEILKIIDEFCPSKISIEKVFINTNAESSQKLIMARTTAVIAMLNKGYDIIEYTPNQIKKNITGCGHATKEQVKNMVEKILNTKINANKDAIDALAVAICSAQGQF